MTYTYLNRVALASLALLAVATVGGVAMAQPVASGTSGKIWHDKDWQDHAYVLIRPAATEVDADPERLEVGPGERPVVAYPQPPQTDVPPSPVGPDGGQPDENGIRWQ